MKYTWGVNKLSLSTWLPDTYSNPAACGYEYGQPAVLDRQVSYDGTSVAQEQTFSYNTTWGGNVGNWSSKTTTATTYDELKGSNFSTAYQYNSIFVPTQPNASWFIEAEQVPVESQITYNDWSGATLRTVNKAWQDPYLMTCQSATQNGQIARTDTTYTGYGAVGAYTNLKTVQLLTDKKEWDWGQAPACGSPASGTPRRETQIAYQGFGATPIYPTASILDRPSTVTTNGNGTEAAQTQYAYDGTAVTGAGVTVGRDSTYNGNTTVPRGNATSKTEWLNGGTSPVTTYAYDDTGQMTSMKDPNGNTTQYAYSDNNTYLTQITYPNTGVAHVVKFSYNSADGQLASSTGQNGNVTTYSYSDSLDRLTQINYPDGGQTTYSYNDSPPTPSVTVTKKITSSENTVSTSIMDGVGHVTRTELTSDPQGADYTDSTYDGEGLAWKQSNPYRSTSDPSYGLTTTAYDAIGRTTSVTYPDENAASTVYSGNCSTVTDPQSKARKSCSDGLGRMTQIFEDPSGLNYETDYTYDALDNLIKVTEGSQTRSFVYDSLSRQLSATNPESGAVSYAYDANGNVQTKKDARGVTTTYSYDQLNRLLSKSSSDGTPTANFDYDESSVDNDGIFYPTVNTKGRLSHTWVKYADGNFSVTIDSYDSMGRVQDYWQCTPYNCLTGNIWNSHYTYDLAGDIQSWMHPAGFTITNSVNGAQQITQIQSSLVDSTHPQYLAQSITHTPWGAEQTLENGCAGSGCTNAVETYTYNKRLQPVMIELGTPSNASADYCLAYNYYSSLGSPGSCAVPSQGAGGNGNVMGYFY